jgi:hypothetical protein
MNQLNIPKSPAQAYREAAANVTAYKVGVFLRILWEVTKPLITWSLIIIGAMVASVFYFIFKVLFGGLKS